MTQIKTFNTKHRDTLERDVNNFIKSLGDVKIIVHYTPTLQYYEACVVYEVENDDRNS